MEKAKTFNRIQWGFILTSTDSVMHFCRKRKEKEVLLLPIKVDNLDFSINFLLLIELQHHQDKCLYILNVSVEMTEHFQIQMSFISEGLILNKSVSISVFQNIYWHLQWLYTFLYKIFIFLSWKIKLVSYSYFGSGSLKEIYLRRSLAIVFVHGNIFWDLLKDFHFMIKALLIVGKVIYIYTFFFFSWYSIVVAKVSFPVIAEKSCVEENNQR